jgi:hypothetical protein
VDIITALCLNGGDPGYTTLEITLLPRTIDHVTLSKPCRDRKPRDVSLML